MQILLQEVVKEKDLRIRTRKLGLKIHLLSSEMSHTFYILTLATLVVHIALLLLPKLWTLYKLVWRPDFWCRMPFCVHKRQVFPFYFFSTLLFYTGSIGFDEVGGIIFGEVIFCKIISLADIALCFVMLQNGSAGVKVGAIIFSHVISCKIISFADIAIHKLFRVSVNIHWFECIMIISVCRCLIYIHSNQNKLVLNIYLLAFDYK